MGKLTSIQIEKSTLNKLKDFREYRRETYDELINRLMEIMTVLSRKEPELKEEVLQEIEEARKEVREGKGISTKQLIRELGLKI
ncbi:hypothetical protein KY366_07725 [Candidatus Woesearchaeota archaeon]|nr:hypothetical protein [Candidatus Woesearchaeota archaeon]